MKSKKELVLIFILIALGIYFILFLNLQSFTFTKVQSFNSFVERDENVFSCLSQFNDMKIITKISFNLSEQLRCTIRDWVKIDDDGSFLHNKDVLRQFKLEIEECFYSNIKWKTSDDDYLVTNKTKINHGETVNKKEEYFIVNCKSKNNQSFESAYAKIFKKPGNDIKRKNPFNVLFIGFDSVSRTDFIQNLSLTSNYLVNQLKSNILWRYNIVGDGTPAALIPILTSMHEHELPNTIRNTEDFSYVDEVYPFIWRNYSEYLNYSTLFLEEWPWIGTFQYRMVGMKKPPTNHYIR